jgi:hypothetical protein
MSYFITSVFYPLMGRLWELRVSRTWSK